MKPFPHSRFIHWKPPPGVMSCEEIRWWMDELRRRGWNRGVTQRALGMRHHNWRKATGKSWIYPGEQIRFSRALKRIIRGEVVMQPTGRRSGRRDRFTGLQQVQRAVVIECNPQPLRMPMQVRYDLRAGGFRLSPKELPPENPLPDFKKLVKW